MEHLKLTEPHYQWRNSRWTGIRAVPPGRMNVKNEPPS